MEDVCIVLLIPKYSARISRIIAKSPKCNTSFPDLINGGLMVSEEYIARLLPSRTHCYRQCSLLCQSRSDDPGRIHYHAHQKLGARIRPWPTGDVPPRTVTSGWSAGNSQRWLAYFHSSSRYRLTINRSYIETGGRRSGAYSKTKSKTPEITF